MKLSLAVMATLLLASATASADPWKDESGHGKGRKHDRSEYKEEFRDGNCKVERKWERGGDYKEERKCRSPRAVYRDQPQHGYYEQAPVYVPAAPPSVYVEPGITIHGTVRIPR